MSAKAIYVHIPFCQSICSYCDFTKFLFNRSYVEPYINQLINHINSKEKFNASTIYIGGGTPSCLPLTLLEKVLNSLSNFSKEVVEYTIETNVENISIEFIELLKKYGVNRISIGVQSFNDNHLKMINRKHRYEDIIEKINLLNKLNFKNISIDLIYGLPNQTFNEWKEDLEKAINLNIKHISIYSLMVEEHTIFHLKGIKEQDDEFLEKCYIYGNEFLKENGFTRYEVSNFSKGNEFESKHNLVYWNDLEYVAFGVGASGYENNIRYTNTKSLQKYIEDFSIKDEELIDEYNHKEEYIMLHLRTKYGINVDEYNSLFNENFMIKFKNSIEKLLLENFIEIKENILRVKEDKVYVLNHIIIEFISCL